jgi:drug/metabolite transporter (DMT)-like permease
MSANLIPLFTALLSLLVLAEAPEWYHGLSFLLIAGGLWLAAHSQHQLNLGQESR